MRVEVWTDGAAYKQIGPMTYPPLRRHAGAGFLIHSDEFRCEGKRPLGLATNNEAEYHAIIWALTVALEMGATTAHLRADSDVVLGQVGGTKKCKAPNLQPLRDDVLSLVGRFRQVTCEVIDRKLNAQANLLANAAKKMSLAGVMTEDLTTFSR